MRKSITKFSIGSIVGLISLLSLTVPVFATTIAEEDRVIGSFFGIFSGLYFLFVICACIFGVAIFALWIYLIIDATQRDYGQDTNMLAVGILLLVLLAFPLGFILYWALIMTKYPKKANPNADVAKA